MESEDFEIVTPVTGTVAVMGSDVMLFDVSPLLVAVMLAVTLPTTVTIPLVALTDNTDVSEDE